MESINPFDLSALFGGLSGMVPDTIFGLPTEELVLRLKIISFVASLIFGIGIVYVVLHVIKYRPRFVISKSPSAAEAQIKVAKPIWDKIMRRFSTGAEADSALAIIEADNLADDLLKKMGVLGDTMMERIESLNPSEIPSVLGLKDAHRVRNNIAHTPGFKISAEDAKKNMENYRKFFVELEVI